MKCLHLEVPLIRLVPHYCSSLACDDDIGKTHCPSSNYGNDSCIRILQNNTYQTVMVTDGNTSFAIFIYRCGDLQWTRHGATIGFGASFEFVSNHWLSGSQNVTSIACLNTPDSQFFSLLYKVTESGYTKG